VNLPMPALRLAAPALPAPAPLPLADAGGWKLQLQRARMELSRVLPAPSGLAPQPQPQPERPELESCGMPAAPGHPAAVHTPPPAPTRPASEPPATAPRGSEREVERAPLRVHVQPEPAEGLKVWLGIDGDAVLVAQRATAAVAGLRRSLQSTGARIGSVVCNGVPIGPGALCAASQHLPASVTPTSSKESSWPSVR
jgi:hypothetical protein